MTTLIEEYIGRTNFTGNKRIVVFLAEKFWKRMESIKKVQYGKTSLEFN